MMRPPTDVGQVFNLPSRRQVENLPHVTVPFNSTRSVSTLMETSHEL